MEEDSAGHREERLLDVEAFLWRDQVRREAPVRTEEEIQQHHQAQGHGQQEAQEDSGENGGGRAWTRE